MRGWCGEWEGDELPEDEFDSSAVKALPSPMPTEKQEEEEELASVAPTVVQLIAASVEGVVVEAESLKTAEANTYVVKKKKGEANTWREWNEMNEKNAKGKDKKEAPSDVEPVDPVVWKDASSPALALSEGAGAPSITASEPAVMAVNPIVAAVLKADLDAQTPEIDVSIDPAPVPASVPAPARTPAPVPVTASIPEPPMESGAMVVGEETGRMEQKRQSSNNIFSVLTERIKDLEINHALSQSYVQELSESLGTELMNRLKKASARQNQSLAEAEIRQNETLTRVVSGCLILWVCSRAACSCSVGQTSTYVPRFFRQRCNSRLCN
jgi:hypothetical protein